MTVHRSIGGKKLIAAGLLALTAGVIVACVPPKPPTTPTTTTTAGPATTTTAAPTTTTTTVASTTTTTTVPSNPVLTLGSGTPVALTIGAGQASKTVDVNYTSPASNNQRTYLYVCFEDGSSPTFNYLTSCSNDSEITKNPVASNTGTFTNYAIFHGQEPTGDVMWGLFGAGETAPAGVTKYTTGYLRFTTGTPSNTTDQQFIPFTFSVS